MAGGQKKNSLKASLKGKRVVAMPYGGERSETQYLRVEGGRCRWVDGKETGEKTSLALGRGGKEKILFCLAKA